MELFRLLGTIVIEDEEAVRAIKKLTQQARESSATMAKAYSKMGEGLTKAGNKITNCITKPAIVAGTALAGMTLAKGWSRMVQIDNAKAKLTGLGHSAKEVTAIMNNALESVKGTAYGMDEAATTAASAVAAGIPVGKDLTRYLSLVADAAAIAGTDMQEMGSIFNKVASNGKISAEEINQLADRGIPAMKLLAEATGMSMEEVQKAVSEGKIGIEEFQDAIEKGMGGAAKTMGSTTITGAIQNIGAAISRIGANFLGSADDANSFAGQLLPILNDVTEWLGKVEEKAKDAGEKFGRAFSNAVETIRNIPTPLIAIGSAIALLAGPLISLTGKFISTKAAIVSFLVSENSMSITAGIANGELTLQQAILLKLGVKLKNAASGAKTFATHTVASALAVAKDTAAKVINAVATSKIGTAASSAVAKVLALAAAHKVATVAALGLAAPIIALAVYMIKTGATADEVAAQITGFADKLAGMITGFANAFPSMVDSFVGAFTSVIEAITGALPTLVPALIQAGLMLFMALVDSLTQIIEPLVATLPTVINALIQAIIVLVPALLQAAITLFMALVDAIPQIIPPLIEAIPQIIDAILGMLPTLVPALLQGAVTLFMAFVQAIPKIVPALIQAWGQIVTTVKTYLAEAVSNVWDSIKSTAKAKWEGIKSAITSPVENARDLVKKAIDKMRSFFNFSWSLPKLKLPHISISGKFSIKPPSAPKFSIQWYRKAMDEAMLLDSPTIFGYGDGGFLGGGEAGQEFISGSKPLTQMVKSAVSEEVGAVSTRTVNAIEKLTDLLGQYLTAILNGMGRDLVLDTGALVGGTKDEFYRQMGMITATKSRRGLR